MFLETIKANLIGNDGPGKNWDGIKKKNKYFWTMKAAIVRETSEGT